jgi:hypothetical protein
MKGVRAVHVVSEAIADQYSLYELRYRFLDRYRDFDRRAIAAEECGVRKSPLIEEAHRVNLDIAGPRARPGHLVYGVLHDVLFHQPAGDQGGVIVGNRDRRALPIDPPRAEQDRAIAQALHRGHIVRNEKDRRAQLPEFANPGEALDLEERIAHGQRFVDDQHLGTHCRRHAECEPNDHPARIRAQRLIEVRANFGEGLDLGETRFDIRP